MWEKLVLKFGLPKILGAIAIVLALAVYVGWPHVQVWWYKHKVERVEKKLDKVTEQRDVARANVKVAQANEAQTERASEITAKTSDAMDNHAAEARNAAAASTEVINERIRAQPAGSLPAPDHVVWEHAHEAYARARAAEARLQGTSGR